MSGYTYDDVAQLASAIQSIMAANLSEDRCAKMVKPLTEELLVITTELLDQSNLSLNLGEAENRLYEERNNARRMCSALRREFGAEKTWPFPWEAAE